MEIAFRPLDTTRDDDVRALADWANDPTIRHLHVRCPSEASYRARETVESAREHVRRALARGAHVDMILADGAVVGQVDLEVDAPPLHDRTPGSAWLGLVIGVAQARGRGLGAAAMRHAEAVARQRGCVRVEVGVFEFNEVARRLYARCGYAEIARLPGFTWWAGRTWTDLRLEKRL